MNDDELHLLRDLVRQSIWDGFELLCFAAVAVVIFYAWVGTP